MLSIHPGCIHEIFAEGERGRREIYSGPVLVVSLRLYAAYSMSTSRHLVMYISVCGRTVQATQVEVSGAVSWSLVGLGKGCINLFRVLFCFFKFLKGENWLRSFFFFFDCIDKLSDVGRCQVSADPQNQND